MTWTEWERVEGESFDFENILYHKRWHEDLGGGIAKVSINRPDRRNALDADTMDEMFRAFYDASHDRMLGGIILTGEGDHFGVGGDVEWERWGLREQFHWRYPPDRLLRLSRKPVIAVVRGYCIAGSNHLAYSADFTIATETAIFGQNGPRVGSPADGAFVPYLIHVIGAKKAREMWMLCRRYTAVEAERMGLVNSVVPERKVSEEIDRWCEELLRASPGCIEILKATFDQILDQYPNLGIISSQMYPDWFDSAEGREGPEAFLDRRDPDFWGIRRAQVRSTDAEERTEEATTDDSR